MVARGERIEPTILRLFSNALAGSIKDVQIKWDVRVMQAPEHPILFQGKSCSIFARLEDEGQEVKTVKISGRTTSGTKEWVIDILPITDKNLPVSKLWARQRIRDLEEGHTLLGGSCRKERVEEVTAKEIIEISRKYGIISSKTSFVGVEKRPKSKKSTSEIVLRKVPAMLTSGWGGQAFRPQYANAPLSFMQSGANQSLSVAESCLFAYHNRDLLLEILSLQRPGGGFKIEASVRMLLQIPPSDQENFVSCKSNEIRAISLNKLEVQMRIYAEEIADITHCLQDQINRIKGIAEGQSNEIMGITKRIQEMLQVASLKSEEMRAVALKIEELNMVDLVEMLETMMVLHLLEIGFNSRRSEWEGITEKSRNWIEAKKRILMPMVANQMETCVGDFVKDNFRGAAV